MYKFISDIYNNRISKREKSLDNANTFVSKSEIESIIFDTFKLVIEELKIHTWDLQAPPSELITQLFNSIDNKSNSALKPINHEVLLKRISTNKTLYVDLTNNSGLVEELLLPNFKYALITDFDEEGFKFSIDSEDEYRDYESLINCTFVDREPCYIEREKI